MPVVVGVGRVEVPVVPVEGAEVVVEVPVGVDQARMFLFQASGSLLTGFRRSAWGKSLWSPWVTPQRLSSGVTPPPTRMSLTAALTNSGLFGILWVPLVSQRVSLWTPSRGRPVHWTLQPGRAS